MADEDLLTLMVRVKVTDVHCITMKFLCGPEKLSVIIYSAGAHADLLLSIVIQVSYHNIMVSASVSRIALIESGIEYPALYKLLILNIYGRERKSCVIASSVNC